MHKIVTQLEHIVEGKVFQFVCQHDSQVSHAREALCKFLAYLENVEQSSKAYQAQQESAKKTAQAVESVQSPALEQTPNP